MLCPNCESENRDDAKFCDECGFPLGGAIARAAVSSTPSASASFSSVGDGRPSEPELETEQKRAQDRSGDYSPVGETLSLSDDRSDSASEAVSDSGFESENLGESDPGHTEEDRTPGLDPDITTRLEEADSASVSTDDSIELDSTQALDGDGWAPVSQSTHYSQDEQDRFAGFSSRPDEDDGFDYFGDDPRMDDARQSNAAHGSGFTMQMPRVEGAPKPANKDFRASTSSTRRPPKAALIVIGVVAVAVIVAVLTFVLGLWGGIAVPDVRGMTESDAKAVLEDNGFKVRSTQVKSDDTEGLVLVMDPAAGSRAGEGSEIVIHIATARFIPDIVGKSYDDAAKLLQEAGYENVRYEKVKSTDAENFVLSVTPEAGTRAKSSMEVVVGVSEAYRVPDISGMDLSAAQEAITKGGLVPQVVYVDTQAYPEGTVLGTTPDANTKVSEGDYVSINVARARAAELVALTEQMFAPGSTATIGGTSIAVDSIDYVTFVGDDTVSFRITGRPFASLMGETVYGSSTSVEGQVVWSDNNEVVSVS